MNLSDLLSGPAGNILLGSVKSQLGMDSKEASNAIGVAVPAILSGLTKNAQSPKGAESLDNALSSKHNGGILGDLGGALGNMSALQQDGNGILDHIFGKNKNAVQTAAAKQAGVSTKQMSGLFAMLAPIVMGFLGKEKNSKKANAGGLSDILGGLLSSSTGGNQSAGGIVDLVGGLLGGGSTKSSGGGLGNILGSILKK